MRSAALALLLAAGCAATESSQKAPAPAADTDSFNRSLDQIKIKARVAMNCQDPEKKLGFKMKVEAGSAALTKVEVCGCDQRAVYLVTPGSDTWELSPNSKKAGNCGMDEFAPTEDEKRQERAFDQIRIQAEAAFNCAGKIAQIQSTQAGKIDVCGCEQRATYLLATGTDTWVLSPESKKPAVKHCNSNEFE